MEEYVHFIDAFPYLRSNQKPGHPPLNVKGGEDDSMLAPGRLIVNCTIHQNIIHVILLVKIEKIHSYDNIERSTKHSFIYALKP
jgi:hypothetical protein